MKDFLGTICDEWKAIYIYIFSGAHGCTTKTNQFACGVLNQLMGS